MAQVSGALDDVSPLYRALQVLLGEWGALKCIELNIKLYPVSYHQHQCHSFSIYFVILGYAVYIYIYIYL